MIFFIFKWSSQTPFGEPQSVILQKMETLVWEEQYDHCIFSKIVVLTLEYRLFFSF